MKACDRKATPSATARMTAYSTNSLDADARARSPAGADRVMAPKA